MARKIISLILKSIVTLSVVTGVVMHVVADYRALLFFTTQSNIWIGVTCVVGLVLMLAKRQPTKLMYSAKLVFTVSITLTGVVYCTMLAPFLGAGAYTFGSTLLHVVVPVVSVADFFVYDYPAAFKKWECLTVTIPPFYYLVFAGIGYALKWDFGYGGQNYPYFFLNWGSPAGAFGFSDQSPYIGVVYYVLILLGFVVGVGALYILLTRLMRARFLPKE